MMSLSATHIQQRVAITACLMVYRGTIAIDTETLRATVLVENVGKMDGKGEGDVHTKSDAAD